jgi:hypothetical protein
MSSRTLLAILAIGLLVAGFCLLFQSGTAFTYSGGFIKSGLVTGALWLALPQLTSFFTKTPRWLLIGGGIAIAFAVMNPMLLLIVIPVVAGLWVFGPRLLASAKSKVKDMPAISQVLAPPPPQRRARRKREE